MIYILQRIFDLPTSFVCLGLAVTLPACSGVEYVAQDKHYTVQDYYYLDNAIALHNAGQHVEEKKKQASLHEASFPFWQVRHTIHSHKNDPHQMGNIYVIQPFSSDLTFAVRKNRSRYSASTPLVTKPDSRTELSVSVERGNNFWAGLAFSWSVDFDEWFIRQ